MKKKFCFSLAGLVMMLALMTLSSGFAANCVGGPAMINDCVMMSTNTGGTPPTDIVGGSTELFGQMIHPVTINATRGIIQGNFQLINSAQTAPSSDMRYSCAQWNKLNLGNTDITASSGGNFFHAGKMLASSNVDLTATSVIAV
ncbi:MAG: hypothetical protein WAV16_01555 [Candidatus Moraniibacteriota bacterium]